METLWRGLSRRQQLVVIGGAVLFLATLALFVQLMNREDYRELYSGLAPAEAQAVASRLAAQQIPYELSANGSSVRVPASKLDAVRLSLAAEGLPQSGRLGFELFDEPNWAGSDFAERVNYQRALEGELERTIQAISGVEAVRVHLVLPQDSLYAERAREAKASVVLKLRGGRLAADSLAAITQLVASAVEGLRPENVAVVDADGRLPRMAAGEGGVAGSATPDEELAKRLVAALTPVVGAGGVQASVSVEHVLSTTERTDETYDPNQAVVLTSQISEERMEGAAATGIPGTDSNVPEAAPENPEASRPPAEPVQLHRTDNKTYTVSRTIQRTVDPPGTIKRITAAVLIDDAVERVEQEGQTVEKRRPRTPEEMERFREIAAAAIGIDPERGDKLAVENLTFAREPAAEPPVPPAGLQRYLPVVNRWVGALRYAGLLALFGIVYLLLLRPVKKQMLAAFQGVSARLPEGAATAGLPAAPAAGASLSAGAGMQLESGPAADTQRALQLKQHVVNTVRKEPVGASRVIQGWIASGEESI